MKKDLRIIPDEAGTVVFDVHGKQEDTGLALLQRLYILLLSDLSTEYRGSASDYSILQFIEGSNRATDEALNALLAISCANAIAALDEEDRDNISAFSGVGEGENIVLTLTLKDGTTISGVINAN